MNFRGMTDERLAEESLIELAYAILEDKKQAMPLNDLLKEIQKLNGISDADLKARLVQFYTDLNVEGRFLLNQENGWGLREWYKVETIEEETAPTIKTRKKKAKVAEEDEDLVDLDEEDVLFEEDFDEFVEEEEDEEDVEDVDVDEDIDFVEEDIDEDIDPDIDEELIDEEDGFIIEDEDEEEDEEDEELK